MFKIRSSERNLEGVEGEVFVQFSSDDGQIDLEAHKLQRRVQSSSFLYPVDENVDQIQKLVFAVSELSCSILRC
jgi:hypothetical protein